MKLLLIHRYFWPDTPPYASILRSIAGRLAADGHDVTVFSTQPSYNASQSLRRQPRREILDGFRLVRCWASVAPRQSTTSRLLDALLFSAQVFSHILFGGYRVVMAGSIPPVALATACRLAARLTGARFVYHHMDIHPEAGAISGLMPEGMAYRLLRRIDTNNCRRAALVVVLSQDMADTIANRSIPMSKIRVLNNFEPDTFSTRNKTLPHDLHPKDDALRVVFAGNIGHFQALDNVIEAAHRLPPGVPARIEILGEGLARPTLERQAGHLLDNRVRFHGHRSFPTSKAFIASSDLALITLKPGMTRVAFPSKTMTYLACSTPLLVMVDTQSELARLVQTRRIGFVVPPGDAIALADVIQKVARERSSLIGMQQRAHEVFRSNFERSAVLEKWSKLYRELQTTTRLPF